MNHLAYLFATYITTFLKGAESFVWEIVGFPLIVVLGLYFTIVRARGVQFRAWWNLRTLLKRSLAYEEGEGETRAGIAPWKIFMTSVGGAVGVGNIVGICLAVQMGGPGALFWVWIVAVLGVILKYSEVYLGMKTRILGPRGYEGGPTHYLPRAFPEGSFARRYVASIVAMMLCIYGVEIYQFHVMVDSVTYSWGLDRLLTTCVLLALVLGAAAGGLQRVSFIASRIVPFLIALFLLMSLCVVLYFIQDLPATIMLVLSSAFTGHAPIAGFAGASALSCIQYGIARGCYASDIGIGYNAMLHVESQETSASKQASLTFAGVLIDLMGICTLSLLMVLVSGAWLEQIDSSLLVQHALGKIFPAMDLFMPVMILLLGYSTVIAFFSVGLKSAQFLAGGRPELGRRLFFLVGGVTLFFFSFLEVEAAMSFMALCGGLLLVLHLVAFWRLRKEIDFDLF